MSQFVNANGNTLLNLKFSLEEQETGMQWIDGKKIYTKVIKATGVLSKAETSNIKHDIINLSEFVDYDVFVQGDDGLYRLPVVYYSSVTSHDTAGT